MEPSTLLPRAVSYVQEHERVQERREQAAGSDRPIEVVPDAMVPIVVHLDSQRQDLLREAYRSDLESLLVCGQGQTTWRRDRLEGLEPSKVDNACLRALIHTVARQVADVAVALEPEPASRDERPLQQSQPVRCSHPGSRLDQLLEVLPLLVNAGLVLREGGGRLALPRLELVDSELRADRAFPKPTVSDFLCL